MVGGQDDYGAARLGRRNGSRLLEDGGPEKSRSEGPRTSSEI